MVFEIGPDLPVGVGCLQQVANMPSGRGEESEDSSAEGTVATAYYR